MKAKQKAWQSRPSRQARASGLACSVERSHLMPDLLLVTCTGLTGEDAGLCCCADAIRSCSTASFLPAETTLHLHTQPHSGCLLAWLRFFVCGV